MDIFLDGEGAIYQQLVRGLKNAIATGRLAEGERLPPSRDLCRQLGISRTTVVAAYELLRAEGYTNTVTGSGSYVAKNRVAKDRGSHMQATIPPQNERSRVARSVFDLKSIPGRRPDGVRHAFEYGQPVQNKSMDGLWEKELRKAISRSTNRYPRVQGNPELRGALAHHIERSRGIVCDADDIIIVAGVQQAIQVCIQALLNVGDAVAFEEPGYFSARSLFQIAGAKVIPVPVDRDGMIVEQIPPGVQLIYVTPSHQFPTGAVLSEARRSALLEYARRTEAWVIEDDYDGEFRINGPAVHSLHSSDRHGRTVYVGTLSKSFSAGIRLGYIVAPPALHRDLLAAKWCLDFGSPALEQMALAGLVQSGAYARHLRWVSEELLNRRTALSSELMARFGATASFALPRSGMHLLATFEHLGADAGAMLVRRGHQEGLGIYTVDPCYLEPPGALGLILGFSTMSVADIREGMGILEHVMSPLLQQVTDNAANTGNVIPLKRLAK
ncbi:PLP-dependent aminotransferase family protein [Solilutibacter silvestris]|uniref:MocR-type Transcriptional regulator n=1 Tax=Solilutibacter silvestris TaxID=1645665 RepID=A0A2K1Q127_9GAMM|nr:PLP-dependent aminotransferase family protein [Lysobacter silvestris]PNS08740.1 MocR-type Transcriptional regulator [Lysobacter silvestris]